MKILVTGGAGFIGSTLVLKLLDAGHEVVSIDNLNPYYDPDLKRARLARFADRVESHEIDIADTAALEAVFKKHSFDAICHLAAQAGVLYSLENPQSYAESNYTGTINVFDLARRYGNPRIVFASTSSIYGLNKTPFSEDDRVDEPVSIYAASKRACELLAYTYVRSFDMHITCLRFFTVYGPWGRPDMALFKFVKNILAGEPIDVYNNGNMRRDFTYVDDIVSGFIAALEKPQGFEIVNLGHGEPVFLLDFIKLIEKELGIPAKINMMPMQMGDVPVTWAETSKAKSLLGWEAKVPIEEGVPKFIEWYREYYNIPKSA